MIQRNYSSEFCISHTVYVRFRIALAGQPRITAVPYSCLRSLARMDHAQWSIAERDWSGPCSVMIQNISLAHRHCGHLLAFTRKGLRFDAETLSMYSPDRTETSDLILCDMSPDHILYVQMLIPGPMIDLNRIRTCTFFAGECFAFVDHYLTTHAF